MRSSRLCLLAAAALVCTAPPCVRADTAGSAYSSRVWETDDGLPHNGVNALVQGRAGFLWLATQSGLVRFDGLEFRKWRSPLLVDAKSTAVRAIIAENADSILVACDRTGLVRLQQNVLVPHPLAARMHEAQRIYFLFREADDVFWVLFSNRDLWRCDHGNLEVFPAPAGLPMGWPGSFARTKEGGIYISRGAGVERYESGKLTRLDELPAEACTVASSRKGGLWMATANRLLKFDAGTVAVVSEPVPWAGELPPSALLESRDRSLWIGTRTQGVFRWDSGSISAVQTSHPRINDMFEDDEGNIWISTAGGGLNRIQRARFTLLSEDAGLTTDIFGSVCEVNGDIWFANRNTGILRISDGRIEYLSQREGWPKKPMLVCPDRAGNVWITTSTQLLRTNADAAEPPSAVPIERVGTIHCIFESRDGSLWIGGETAPLVRLKEGRQETFGEAQGFTGTRVQAIGEDASGHLWVGTERGEILHMEGGHFFSCERKDSFRGSQVRSIYGDADGNVWIGVGGGALLVGRDGNFSQITEAHGLPDDVISQIVEDNFGSMWLGSSRGLFKVRKDELLECAAGRKSKVTPILFGKDDGLAGFSSSANYQPAVWKAASGRLWFVARKGLVSTDPAPESRGLHGPRVHIDGFSADGEVVTPGTRLLSTARKFEFSFTAPTFIAPEKVRFRYRLDPFESGWTEVGTQRAAIYPKLPPGEYEFQVTAANSDFLWNPKGAGISFKVLPAWWETPWARGAAIALGGVVLVGIPRLWSHRRLKMRLARLESERRLEGERARIARDLHDGLGASLTQAGMMAEELCEDCHDMAEMRSQSSRLAERVRTIARDLDAAVWSVSPKNDTLASLCSYLCQFALEYFRDTRTRCRVHTEDHIPNSALTPEARHHLFLTAQEAMNNALKHAGASEVRLTMRMQPGGFEIAIADDGHGFQLADSQNSDRNGLRNMRTRMAEVGGQLDIESSKDGTLVRIHLPIQPGIRPHAGNGTS